MRCLLAVLAALLVVGCSDPQIEYRDCYHGLCTSSREMTVPPTAPAECSSERGIELFTQRIRPLVSSGRMQTCNQCHLTGIDLNLFVRDTSCESMACLLEQSQVDFETPPTSQILERIELADPDSSLITQEVIDEEYEGFLEWIVWSATCHDAVCGTIVNACGVAPPGEDAGTPAPPGEDAGPPPPPPASCATGLYGCCDQTALVNEFRRLVEPHRNRCAGCHGTTPLNSPPPPGWVNTMTKWWDTGTNFAASANTVEMILTNRTIGRNRTYVNRSNPRRSQFLLQPLAESEGGVRHGGGDKIEGPWEQVYQDMLTWLTYYASCYSEE